MSLQLPYMPLAHVYELRLKKSVRMFRGCKDTTGSLWKMPETTRINRDGRWRRSWISDIHGYSWRCIQTIGIGFMDGNDVSRTIRTGFTDIFSVSHSTQELTERCFVMNKTLYKGHLAFC